MSKETNRIKLTPAATREHLLQYFDNCETQIGRGLRPTSLCVEGKAGIAKTSLLKQTAQSLGYKFHQINAAMIDDLGHLVGFPEKEYQMEFFDREGDVVSSQTRWVPAEFSENGIQEGGKYTGNSRMAYAVPHWLKEVNPDEKFVLLLDDFTRGLPMVMQACMTLVEEYRYGSWELPKNSVILLTTNPDNGEYSVASLDHAQKTRMRYVEMIFDVDSWAQWAESDGIDGRCINFVLNNRELFSEKHDGIGGGKEYNARIMTKFFTDIGCLKNFTDSLSYVKICGDGSVGKGFTDHFITFVHNKMDLLPHPDQLLKMDSEKAQIELNKVCGNYKTKDSYNPATASIMASRLTNYIIYGNHDKWGKDENTKAVNMILHNCFSEDLKFYMARQFMSDRAKQQSTKLQYITLHPEIVKMMFS
jgi:hypothetical protein